MSYTVRPMSYLAETVSYVTVARAGWYHSPGGWLFVSYRRKGNA